MSFYKKEREDLQVQVQQAIEATRAGQTGTVNFGPMHNRASGPLRLRARDGNAPQRDACWWSQANPGQR
jgi:hypothetical protein